MLASYMTGGGGQPVRDGPLPFVRMLIVFLMLGSFALAFAELVRQSDELSVRPEPTASRCGEASGPPCPTQGTM